MKILLFGKGGQLGWELQRSLATLGELVALDFDTPGELCGDFTRLADIAATVRQVRPDVVVNAAAYTAVDKAESELELARRINAEAPGALADAAEEIGAWFVHYSTDYVFDGSGERPWREEDATNPLSVYGQTKRDGEIAAARCRKHLIFRTSWVYAARGGNFIRTMLKLAQERERLTVINDQVGAPTGADLLADVTAHAVRAVCATPARSDLAGLYHLVAGGETSWYGYARLIIEQARNAGLPVRVAPDAIVPIPTEAYPLPAPRPRNSRLDTSKLQAAYDLVLPDWRSGVLRALTEILKQ